jgi:hypothetical protein
MRLFKINSRLVILGLVLIYSCAIAAAQYNNSQSMKKSEEQKIAKQKSPHTLYAGTGFGNNMIFMGSDISQSEPFYTGSLTYGFKSELLLSASVFHLSAFDPLLSFAAFALSYNHDFNSWLDISLSASRYQVKNDLTDTLFNNFLYGDLALGIDWKVLYSSISVRGIFSESSSAYFNFKNSRYFQTRELSGGKAYFYFDPYINLLFGTLTKTVTAEGTTIGVSSPFKTKGPSSHGGSGSNSGSVTTYFSLMEADFGIPAGFTIGKLSLEAEPGYILPVYKTTGIQSPRGFTLLINVYLQIF